MHIVPDVVGLVLEEALSVLEQYNDQLSVIETFSPKTNNKEGECRIIHQKIKDNKIELVVSYF